MVTFPFTPSERVMLPIKGSTDVFPVRRVYCIGRNYADHAIEMGHDPDKEPPFFFQKNPDNLNVSGQFPYPVKSSNVHHEAELAVLLKSGGDNISVSAANTHILGYAAALDMTRRDLQGEMKKMGRPWEIGKAFEHSAPIGPIHTVADIENLSSGRITLSLNNSVRQDGDLNQMIWKIPELVSYLSEYFTLNAGDVILTGTPAGVGPVQRGDTLTVDIEGLDRLSVIVT